MTAYSNSMHQQIILLLSKNPRVTTSDNYKYYKLIGFMF